MRSLAEYHLHPSDGQPIRMVAELLAEVSAGERKDPHSLSTRLRLYRTRRGQYVLERRMEIADGCFEENVYVFKDIPALLYRLGYGQLVLSLYSAAGIDVELEVG